MGQFRDALKAEVDSLSEQHRATIKIGNQEITLTARPLTGIDMDFVTKKHKGFVENPTMEGLVDLIIRKAKTEEGNKAFDVGDKPYLLRMDVEKINELYATLFNIEPEGDEDGDQPLGDADLSDDAVEQAVKN
jgi:hypothetical protein